jgi:hypothetical protein
MNRRPLLLAGGAALLAGCAAPSPADYAAERPLLDLKTYFNGKLTGYGAVSDRSGKVRRRFVVAITGTWKGDDGELDERFTYSDGKTEQRIWRIRHLGGGRYSGRADDVVGEAAGVASGNALNWRYTLRVAMDERTIDLDFDDWMLLIDDRVMLNKAVMSKFGVRVGEVLLSFTREGA